MTKPANTLSSPFLSAHSATSHLLQGEWRWPLLSFIAACGLLLLSLLASDVLGKWLGGIALLTFIGSAWLVKPRLRPQLSYQPPAITSRDTLTKLGNRQSFNTYTQRLSEENPTLHKTAMLLIDIDHFMVINDNYGHQIGDKLLVTVSQRVSRLLEKIEPSGCRLFRLSGDEFVVVCPHATSKQSVHQLAQQICDTTQQPIEIGNNHLLVSASIGIAWSDSTALTASQLLRAANTAVRQVKHAGKNQFAFFDDVYPISVLELIEIENRLRKASAKGEIIPWYQPIVDMKSGKVIALEALARWPDSADSDFTPPQNWLRYVNPNLLTDISQLALLQAQVDALRLGAMGIDDLQININITESMLFREEFREILQEICRNDHHAKRPQIAVELTETIFVDRAFDTIKGYLQRIHEAGSKIYLDDFGTGFASLNHLRDLPVDALKIDKEFIIHLDEPANLAIVQAMINLANDLGKTLVCEGLEDEARRDTLLRMGARYGQGYYYAPASSLDDLLPMLEAGRSALNLQTGTTAAQ